MNPHENPLPPIDQRALDLLIDGELPEGERRRLLASLDGIPGGWRACALAFLEAQCWREQMRALAPAASGVGQPPASLSRRRVWPRRVWQSGGAVLAMAASFLLAFVVVSSLRSPRQDSGPPAGGQLAATVSGVEEASASPQPGEAGGALAATRESPVLSGQESLPAPWRMVPVTLPGEQQGAKRTIRLPAVEADRIDDSWLGADTEAMPADVRAALEQFGYRVRNFRRQLIPVPASDGRQLVVPVDQVELHYIGNPSYQ